MSEPVNVFQPTRKHIKTGNFSFLSTQVAVWQKLTKIVQPLLPQPDQWQVVCYINGVLILTGENQALISQLAYLQKQYIAQLSQIYEFKDLHKIQVRLRTPSPTPHSPEKISRTLSTETQDLLRNAADFVSDPKLSQAMLRLASNKK
ncbi:MULTISPECIES: DciA family protein [unclassified Acinetobacter]|uniref:DciA family protein n=1 Tax=unclassified Acinetobacter TaxID=196816 RepID=UPI0015D2580D|nr:MULTISPECIES: DciA family protein [unclassified Acinetobacter]